VTTWQIKTIENENFYSDINFISKLINGEKKC